MPCYQCREEFSFFKREYSCKNCGFSFCSSCLKKEINIPKIKAVGKCCENCFKAITKGTESMNQQGRKYTDDCVPENFKKRMAALDKKNTRPTPYQRAAPVTHQDSVEKRLENLRKERLQNVPSVDVIEQRLTALRGHKSFDCASTTPARLPPTPHKSNEEQTMDLLKQQWDLNRIDAGGKSGADNAPANVLIGNQPAQTIDDLMKEAKKEAEREEAAKAKEEQDMKAIKERLGNLRGYKESDAKTAFPNTEALSEEEQVQLLIKKLSEEARIEGAMEGNCAGVSSAVKDSKEVEEEELPWCCICSEDAVIRCFDCDRDLYCRRCFKEGHTGPDSGHKTTGYRKPPNAASD